ncbi:hypothetical protein Bca4012_010634 [Brassica carinata]|uniref:Uncharacterized protein n=1 Tax=Brassica carinata TaxID=52824 RepID=A0A8X7V1W0_BRACI|nr:hypothetical protein Bca52824_035544 [Brassica carinata]
MDPWDTTEELNMRSTMDRSQPVLTCRIPELDWSLARNGEVVEMRPQVDGVWSRRSTARRRRWSRSHTENSRPGARAQL